MSYDYECTFSLDDCIKKLGLEEKGRVQQFVTDEVMKLADDYVPFDVAGIYEQPGRLKDSVHIENETDVVYEAPYAKRWYYNDFVEDKEGNKIPVQFQGAPIRGAYWVDRMMQNGGREKIEDGAREKVGK